MKNALSLLAIAAVIFVVFTGCGDEEEPPTPPTITAPDITPIPYDDSIRVIWKRAPEAGQADFRGYYIYVGNVDLSTLSASQLMSYLVPDTPYTDTTYLLTRYQGDTLQTNAIYYFGVKSIRTVDGRDTISPMNVVETSPVIVGQGKVFELASDSACAYSFVTGIRMNEGETTYEPNFYFDTCRVCGVTGYALKSPHLAGTFWTGYESSFKFLGTGDPNQYHQTTTTGFANQSEMSTQVYAIRTADNRYVKLWIIGFSGEYPNKCIEFKYKYQTRSGYPHF